MFVLTNRMAWLKQTNETVRTDLWVTFDHRLRGVLNLHVLRSRESGNETFDRKITVIPAGYLLKNRKDIDRDNGRVLRLPCCTFKTYSRERKRFRDALYLFGSMIGDLNLGKIVRRISSD